jgi:hypothetical protein
MTNTLRIQRKFIINRSNGNFPLLRSNCVPNYTPDLVIPPYYLFIILDAAASSELISKNNSSIIQFLKVCRHLHISCAVCIQTVRDSIKE